MALLRRRKDPRSPGISPLRAGIIAVVVIVVAVFVVATKFNPFQSQFELNAMFKTANNLQPGSPVRIAGVDVGAVTQVQPLKEKDGSSACGETGECAKVTMEIGDDALPIHQDAEAKIRSRIFLEGNYFVDVQPGTPGAPKVRSSYTLPINQTATPVQLDQVLTSLQGDTRSSLQTLLKEYAEQGLGNGGAQAYNKGLDYTPDAERFASIANDATLGQQPHDLSALVRGQQRLFKSLSTNPQTLEDLVTQLNTTFQALASEDVPLEQSIPALRDTLRIGRPALASLDNALPSLRTFARAALPGTLSSGPTIDASLPEVTQLRLLIRPQELEGLVRDLRPTIPALAKLNHDSIDLFAENRTLSACQNNVLLPFSNTPIPNPDFPGESGTTPKVLFPQGLVGLAGESRQGDSMTPEAHLQTQTGATTVVLVNKGQKFFAPAPTPPNGTRPMLPDHRPNFRPGVPCELQQVPDLNAPLGPSVQSATETGGIGGLLPPLPINKGLYDQGQQQLNEIQSYVSALRTHQPTVDPVGISHAEYVKDMKKVGFGVTPQGKSYRLNGGGK